MRVTARGCAFPPNQPTATRFSSRIRKADAQPTATGSIAGQVADHGEASFESAMWTLPSRASRPVLAPHVLGEDPPGLDAARDVHAHVAVERRHVVGPIAVATPIAEASLPRPV